MLTVNMLEKNPEIGDEELLDVLSSNLCRCTGYQNIITAVKAVRDEMKPKEELPSASPHVEAHPEAAHASHAPQEGVRISD
jgi:xanthine dehydrogenase iron-sulfur cluster and FAD-binding subunit A